MDSRWRRAGAASLAAALVLAVCCWGVRSPIDAPSSALLTAMDSVLGTAAARGGGAKTGASGGDGDAAKGKFQQKYIPMRWNYKIDRHQAMRDAIERWHRKIDRHREMRDAIERYFLSPLSLEGEAT
ncbi:hypothetical protein T484DRAFT_1818166 [Baffinella frigidus]|nr:hypothetical protein T484DRAFT_1818166 [Cryptophyta sp. CCMP2293]